MSEHFFGRRLDPRDWGSVPTLNDVAGPLLEEARALAQTSRVAAARLLQHYVVRSEADFVGDFIEEVLRGGESPEHWGVHDTLCVPAGEVEAHLQSSIASLLEPIAEIDGQRWVALPASDHQRPPDFLGAPGVLAKGVPYWWQSPRVALGLILRDERVEPVTDPTTRCRRWHATRAAWKLERKRLPDTPTVADLCAALQIAEADLSVDGAAALRGLLVERAGSYDETLAPGFRAPDDVYR